MNRLRGIIAVFVLLFMLSSVSLLLLIIDDKKDLSSRASVANLGTRVKPIALLENAVAEPSVNTSIWLKIEKDLYINQSNSDSLRVLSLPFNTSSISAVLGASFKNPKLLGGDSIATEGWSAEKYSYELFGQRKKVNLWKNSNQIVLEVGTFTNQSTETLNFLKNLTDQNQVLGTSTEPDDSAKLATLIRPSVAMVLNHYCSELKFFSVPGFSLSDKIYPFCLTTVGTGFFISSDGLVATNGHIVKNLPKSALYYGLSSGKLDGLLVDFLNVYLSQVNKKTYTSEEIKQIVAESHTKKEVLSQLGGLIVDLNNKNILKFQNEKNNYYLQLGNKAANISSSGVVEEEGIVGALLVDIDYKESDSAVGFTSSDVAILKAKNGTYPALSLGSIDEAVVGSNLQVVGFPAAAMGQGGLLDTASLSEPTFTKGVVSAIKLAKGNQKKLIQTDAIINHGNSGGPALLLSGKVVGIATYGVNAEDGSGSYNYLRDVQDIKDLVVNQNLNLSQGEVFKLWDEGLKNYWQGYFKYSSEKFQKLIKIYPSHSSAQKYLDFSNAKIDSVEDLTPRFTHAQRSILMYIAGTVMGVSTLVLIVLFVIIKIKSKPLQEEIPSAPTF